MDAPENSGNRIGRTIWTVWGYLSGAVARYLRPEVTDKGNQSVNSRSDEAAVNKTDKDVKAESRENQNDTHTAEIEVYSPDVRAQVSSVQWENTDVAKDDSNDELNVDFQTKQTCRFAMWSTGTESNSGDAHAEKETASTECKESDATHGLEETGKTEQEDAENKECDWNNQVETCVMKDELDHADILVQSELQEQDVDVEKLDHGENEVIGGLKHADTNEVEFVNDEMIENDEEKDLPPLLEYHTDGLSMPEMLNLLDAYSDEIDEFSKNEVDQVELGPKGATEQDKDRETSHKTKQTGKTERDDEECFQHHDDEKCMTKKEDPGYTSITVQSELEKQTDKMDHEETGGIAGFKEAGEHVIERLIDQNDQEKYEKDEEAALKVQSEVEDVLPQLECSTEDTLQNPENLETCCSEIAENVVEDMLLASEKDEDMTESEQNTTNSELHKPREPPHRVSNEMPKNHEPNDELEPKMTTVLGFETVNTSQDTPLSDSKQDTPENTTETGTGSPVVAVKTEGMFSDVIVCEFPGELRKEPETSSTPAHSEESKSYLNDLQSISERRLERDAEFACTVEHSETLKPTEEAVEIEKDIETLIESLDATESQEIDKNKFSLMEDVQLSNKLMSEHEKAESFETESPISITLESRELLEFARGECKSSQDTMVDTLPESLGHSGGSAEVEQVADVDSVLTRSLPPSEFVEETLGLPVESERFIEEQEILETDLVKTALDYVEEITNQVLKEMIETEMLKKTEHSVELSMEELGDAEYRGTENSVSAEAFVLEEERMFLGETMESNVEMEVETESSEDFKQNEQHTSSPKLETNEAERHHEQQTHHCAELSTGTDYLGTNQDDTDIEGHKDDDDAHVESREASSEREYANVECKDSEKNWWTEEKDGFDEKCSMAMKKEDPDNTDMVQSELYEEDVEEYKQINMVDLEETEGTGGLRHSDEHFTDEKEKNVDQNDRDEAEDDENQQPEVEALVLEEEIMLLGETMQIKVEIEVEATTSEDVKQNEQRISSPKLDTTEAETHHEQQTHHCAELSTGTDYLGTNQDDTDIEKRKDDDALVENKEASSEIEYANIEFEDNKKNCRTDQKDGNDEHCAMLLKKEDLENADLVHSELCGADIEEEKQIHMVDFEETEGTGGLRHSDERFTYEKEKNVDQNDQEKLEDDENQQPEVEAPADALVLEEEMMFLGETMESKVEMEMETTSSEDVKQNEQYASSPKLETTDAERHHEEQTHHCAKLSTGTDDPERNPDDTDIGHKDDDDAHVENKEASSEIEYANIECKDSVKTWQIGQKDGNDEHCAMMLKKEDLENADLVHSELCGGDIEEEKQINMVDFEETEGLGGLRHSDEHLTDEKEKNIDQNDQEKPEDDENQQPEVEAPADALVLEEEMMFLVKTMDGRVEMEMETTSIEDVELTCEADGHHEDIQKVIAGEALLRSHKDVMEVGKSVMKRRFGQVNKDPPEVKMQGTAFNLQDSSLDFTIQKSRIAVKNPLVRPPKDPRKLISKPSVEPLLPQPSACSPRVNVSAPSKGVIGFKLPGLGAGMPVLRKTEFGKKARGGGEAEKTPQPQQKSVAEPEDSVKQEQTSAKPKWTPPRHPGMGGPLMMAELKNKLKKPSNE